MPLVTLSVYGSCVYLLFHFCFAFHNTKKRKFKRVVINRFPFFILSKTFIIARYEIWNTVDNIFYRIEFIKQTKTRKNNNTNYETKFSLLKPLPSQRQQRRKRLIKYRSLNGPTLPNEVPQLAISTGYNQSVTGCGSQRKLMLTAWFPSSLRNIYIKSGLRWAPHTF